jgi:thiamine pyrophosphate-dependent acetolactate synthase large subunit-like protein
MSDGGMTASRVVDGPRMPAFDALKAIHAARDQSDIVVTTMTPARDWMTLPPSPLDVVFVPSAMGHATSIALGLALAQPARRVIVCNGDGSMLMNLGSLVSIVGANATNMVVIVFENGVYEVTGAQSVPARGVTDFSGIARAAGFRSIYTFLEIGAWQQHAARILRSNGPVFVHLRVVDVSGLPGPKSPGPARDRAQKLIEALRRIG